MKEYIEREKVIAEIDGCFPANPTSEFSKGVAVGVAMAKVAVNHISATDVCPYYIGNKHDGGDDSLCQKANCEVKAVRPVARGRWETPNAETTLCTCSVCGKVAPYDVEADTIMYWPALNFCPNCGADMRGEQDEKA